MSLCSELRSKFFIDVCEAWHYGVGSQNMSEIIILLIFVAASEWFVGVENRGNRGRLRRRRST